MNARVAPVAILGGLAHDQLPNVCRYGWPARSTSEVAVVFSRDQVPMPREQRIRAHNGPDLPEHRSAEVFRLRGQPNALVVGEAQPSWSQRLPEHAILGLEIRDHVALVLVDPAGQGNDENLEWVREGSHQDAAYQRRCQSGAPLPS